MEKVQTVTGEDIQEQIRRENKVAAAWLIHYWERKRLHDDRRREIESRTSKERDENVGGGRQIGPLNPALVEVPAGYKECSSIDELFDPSTVQPAPTAAVLDQIGQKAVDKVVGDIFNIF